MSLLETACPHCGKSMVFSPIDYINTEERPEMIQKVRDGEAFVSICGHCGKKS
ncbi:CpXC domain-containing protein, partial [Dialister sp.]